MTIQANFPNVQPSLLLDFANAKQLPPSVNFTRATTATYYDGSTTAMAEQNLVLNSSLTSGTTSWGGSTNVLTLNYGSIAAPDGTFTAIRCQPVLTTSFVEQAVAGFNVGGTKSIWARTVTGTANAVLLNYSSGDPQVFALTTTWQRFTVTVTNSTIYDYFFLFDARSGSHTATDFLIWAPQAENRSSATAYTATTTQAITNYIPVLLTAGGGQPRFDHNPTTSESLGLLIEESRTNLFSYSSQFDDAYWVKANCSITANANVAPDGTLSADLATATSGLEEIYRNTTKAASAITYTLSIYVKPYSGVTNSFVLYLSDNSTGQATGSYDFSSVTASATNGTWANSSATITSVGNGWFRCTLTSTSPANTGLLPGFTWGSTSGQAVFLWGAQLEAGSFPTSYIPTTSAAATRAADLATMTGVNFTSWFNNQEGTIYYSGVLNGRRTSGFENVAIFTNGTATTNSFGVGTEVSGNDLRAFVLAGGTLQADLRDGAPQVGTQFKGAFAYQANDFSFCADNGTVQTDSSGLVPSGIDRVTFGVEPAGGSPYNGTINKVAYYPQRITDAQVKALTS